MTRIKPHSVEAEKGLLGCLVMKPDLVPGVGERLKPIDFYAEKNRAIFNALKAMAATNEKIDLVSISEKVKPAVSQSYVSSLVDGLPPKNEIDSFLTVVEEKAKIRDIIRGNERVLEAAYGGDFMATAEAMAALGAAGYDIGKRESLAAKIRKWIELTDTYFKLTDLKSDLQLLTKSEREALYQEINRLKKAGRVISVGKRPGEYRKPEEELDTVDWLNSPTEAFDIDLPLGLNEHVNLYPGNVCVIAGISNAGKTAFMIDVVKRNMAKHNCVYFTSEMGGTETKVRLAKHEDIGLTDWKFQMFERSDHYGDVTQKDCINIIDYVEVGDEFYKMGTIIKDVWDKLGNGIAFIAIQKSLGAELGRGGSFGTEKPRLYLSIDNGEAKIIKAKNWKGGDNPNGRVKTFKLIGGWKFIETSGWEHKESLDAVKPKKRLF